MAKKKKINKRKENVRQRKFRRELTIPEGQVRQRLLKQEDKELVLNEYEPVEQTGEIERTTIDSKSDMNKRFENLDYGTAINEQRVNRNTKITKNDEQNIIPELIDVVELHVYDTDDKLLTSTFVKQGEGWDFLGEGEKQFEKDSEDNFTGEQKRYHRVILEPHKTLRSLNFTRGTYRVHYNFHRNKLGSDHIFYIDSKAEKSGLTAQLIKKDRTIPLDDGSVVIKNRAGKPSNRYLKQYKKKLFIQEISPSRTEVRALPVNAFSNVLNNKFRKEFSGRAENFELFGKETNVVNTTDTGVFLTVDTYPEKQTGKYRGIPGTALVTISKSPSATKDDVVKLFKFNKDMVGGVLTIPRKGIDGVNTYDLYEDFEAEIVEWIDETTVRVGTEFRQPTPIGDVNLDDYVNMLDFEKLFAYIQGEEKLNGLQQYQADLDQDGRIDLADALWTLRIALQETRKLGYTKSGNFIIGKGALTADRVFGMANDLLNHYKMTAAQKTIFDINRDGRIDTIDLLRFLDDDVINVVSEITETMRRPFNIEYENPYYDDRKALNHLLNFGDNVRSLITNWEPDDVSYPDYPHSIVFKLYEPLPKSIKQKSYFHIVEEITPSVIEDVVLTGEVEEAGNFKLRPPDWDNIDTKYVDKTEPVELSSWDNLLTTSSVTSQQLIEKYFSGSYDGTEIKLDYREYENYVYFGSAAERLANFKYKIQLLESYSSSIALESGISGSLTSINSYKSKQSEIINGFDSYEKYLYFDSGSTYTDSFRDIKGTFWVDKTWPKVGTGSSVSAPYELAKVDSEVAMNWFDNEFVSASAYDKSNPHSLINSLPIHLKENNDNEQYFLFLDMIGQHFDVLWAYIKNLTNITKRSEREEEGVPRDLVYHIVKSMGHQLDLGNNVLDLWEYALGSDPTGSFKYDNRESFEDISKETWRRIGNNLPYILKHKGTARSIKALLACYGVPNTILRIREYGGPVVLDRGLNEKKELEQYRKGSYIEDDGFIYAAKFNNFQSIKGDWNNTTTTGRYPDTVEFMFRTNNTVNKWETDSRLRNQLLFSISGSTDDWAVTTRNSGSSDKYGYVVFSLSGSAGEPTLEISSSKTTIFDNSWYNVMVRRNSGSDGSDITQSYQLFVKKFDDEYQRITYNSSQSLSVTSSTHNASWTGSEGSVFLIGGNTNTSSFGVNLIGNMIEHRQWATALSESSFENHTQAPQSYNGNNWVAGYDDLILRYKLDTAQDYETTTTIVDTKPNQKNISTFPTKSGVASGFGSTDYEDVYIVNRMVTPNIGPNRRVDNKVRLEDNDLHYGRLSVNKRSEKSSYDTQPVDSPKVGVYLSPSDIINDDIIRNMADMDFDSMIGDPRDQFRDNYPDLQIARELYFRKFEKSPVNVSDYIDVVRLYDLSLFDQIKRLMPARSKTSTGVLVEPHILERPKVKWEKPIHDNRYYEGEMEPTPSQSGEFIQKEGVTSPTPELEGNTPNYEGETERLVVSEGEEQSYEGEYVRPVDTEGEETTFDGETERLVITEGEETTYTGETERLIISEGEETLYDGDAIEDTSIPVEGEFKDLKGTVQDELNVVEGNTLPLETEIEDAEHILEGNTLPLDTEITKPVNQLEGRTQPLDGTIPDPDIYTTEGETIDIGGVWHNPHKNVTSEYNRKQFVKIKVTGSDSRWDGVGTKNVSGSDESYGITTEARTVYTMAGAKFPSQYPDVEGTTSHSIEYLTEALLPPITKPTQYRDSGYLTKKVLLETEFNAGKYASSMKQKYGVGIENVGDVPKYLEPSKEINYRGWFSGSNASPGFQFPYFVLDDGNYGEVDNEEILVDENGDYIIDGISGSAALYGENTSHPFKRTGAPKTFEIRELRLYDKENLIHNKFNMVQALYFENEYSSSAFNMSSSVWPWSNIPAPDNSDSTIDTGSSAPIQWDYQPRGFYSRFGLKGKFEFEMGEQYELEFDFMRVGEPNPNQSVTVHLLDDLETDIDKFQTGTDFGSKLIGNVYKTGGFRKRFMVQTTGTYKIVFVVHGGIDSSNNPYNQFKFYITRLKLCELERARYNPPTFYSTAFRNLYYEGCKNTIKTTTDGEAPIEWTDSNPNVLVVDPTGDTDLDVV